MSQPITLVCALFRPKHAKFTAGSAGWGLYDPSWADKLYRGVRRNMTGPLRCICLTDQPDAKFAEPIEPVPFIYPNHVGDWMCLNEMFRLDLGVERGIIMGLDTIIVSNIDDILGYSGPIAFTKSHEDPAPYERSRARPNDKRNVREVCNAVVLYDGPKCAHIWETYIDNPARANQNSVAEWSAGLASEMVFWREECREDWDVIPPGRALNFGHNYLRRTTPHPTASIVYFHGASKPSEELHPILSGHWI